MLPGIVVPTRRIVLIAVALAASIALASYVSVARDAGLPDGTAFKVNGVVVSQDAVASRMKAFQALYGVQKPQDQGKVDTFTRDTAKSMVVERLMEDAAQDKGIVVADKTVSDALAELIAQRYPDGGRRAFVAALGEMGASEQQVRDEIAQQMIVARLFDEVTKDADVSVDDVHTAFEQRRNQLGTPEQRVIRNIVVKSRADAESVLSALRSGADFGAVARRSSLDGATRAKGGLLGTVTAEQLDAEYAASAFAAAVGQPFGPVQTKYGWNIGLVTRAVPARPATFASVAKQLKTTLVQEKSVTIWTAWLRDLIGSAVVEYADAYLPADPNGVPDLAS